MEPATALLLSCHLMSTLGRRGPGCPGRGAPQPTLFPGAGSARAVGGSISLLVCVCGLNGRSFSLLLGAVLVLMKPWRLGRIWLCDVGAELSS